MSLSKITIQSFNTWLDGKLFDEMILPDGIDKDVLIKNILLEGAEFEVMYSNPNFMAEAIGLWSQKYYRTFEKWVTALDIEYNPLENYDRMEEWHDNGKSTGTINTSQNDTVNTNTSAYDSSSYVPDAQSVSNGSSNSTSNGTNTNDRTGRTHGNIGVTTSQQMLQSELDIAKWNIYKHITDLFLQEFTIMVYV